MGKVVSSRSAFLEASPLGLWAKRSSSSSKAFLDDEEAPDP
jgi:hypothetical protein